MIDAVQLSQRDQLLICNCSRMHHSHTPVAGGGRGGGGGAQQQGRQGVLVMRVCVCCGTKPAHMCMHVCP
jgi:hypothetical protein